MYGSLLAHEVLQVLLGRAPKAARATLAGTCTCSRGACRQFPCSRADPVGVPAEEAFAHQLRVLCVGWAGYRRYAIKGRPYPAIVSEKGHTVEGQASANLASNPCSSWFWCCFSAPRLVSPKPVAVLNDVIFFGYGVERAGPAPTEREREGYIRRV